MTNNMKPMTKIVCTIGPASASPRTLERLIRAGMSVARLNFSHGTHGDHGRAVSRIRRLSRDLGRPVSILQDLAGPKVRIGEIESGSVTLRPASEFILTTRRILGSSERAAVSYAGLARDVRPGDPILLNDGAIELKVLETAGPDIRCRVVVGGSLSSHKGVNLPSRSIRLSGLTAKDKADLRFGAGLGVDYVALSFVRSVADIRAVKALLRGTGREIPVIAKIEKHEALDDLEAIVGAADGVMVARGDLGVEIPLERIAWAQKKIIRTANGLGKPVITATQMLRSMVENPRPTRAEVTDVANAILDGTDALMLSEETAIGRYPVEAVKIMTKISGETERGLLDPGWRVWADRTAREILPTAEAVAAAACALAAQVGASLIVTFTRSGSTARLVSKYRPPCPILAPTSFETTYRRLGLLRGVIPWRARRTSSEANMVEQALVAARESGLARRGAKLVITAGVPSGPTARTNLIRVEILE
jgi:pyruvate kinase